MKTTLIPAEATELLDKLFIDEYLDENKLSLDMTFNAFPTLELEEAKKSAKVKDFITVKYEDRQLPFQIVHKHPDGRCVLQSWYVLEERRFDPTSNDYSTSEIRSYLNGEFLKKLDPEFEKEIKVTDVSYGNQILKDKVFLPSHEEIGYKDTSNYFMKNKSAICFDAYRETENS